MNILEEMARRSAEGDAKAAAVDPDAWWADAGATYVEMAREYTDFLRERGFINELGLQAIKQAEKEKER